MKKILLAAAVLASAVSGAQANMKSFTGFYMGANVGYGMGNVAATTSGTGAVAGGVAQKSHLAISGVKGGVHLGYGWILQRVYYVGLEAFGKLASMDGASQNRNTASPLATNSGFTKARQNNSFGAALHFGGMINSMLAYVKVGAESASWKFEQAHDSASFGAATAGTLVGASKTRRFVGIPMGLGVATMLTDRIVLGGEFVYTHYPSATTVSATNSGQTISTNFRPKTTEFNVRLSYKW